MRRVITIGLGALACALGLGCGTAARADILSFADLAETVDWVGDLLAGGGAGSGTSTEASSTPWQGFHGFGSPWFLGGSPWVMPSGFYLPPAAMRFVTTAREVIQTPMCPTSADLGSKACASNDKPDTADGDAPSSPTPNTSDPIGGDSPHPPGLDASNSTSIPPPGDDAGFYFEGSDFSSVSYTGADGAWVELSLDAPEPASWALIVVGSGVAGAALRRRRMNTLLGNKT